MSDYLDPYNEELLADFFLEANMQLEILEKKVLALEADPSNKDAVDEIFRAAHTLKGGAGAVNMTEITHFTHLLENLLDDVRSEKIPVSSEVIDAILNSSDVLTAMIDSRQNQEIYEDDISEILAWLNRLLGAEEEPVSNPVQNISPVTQAPPPTKPVYGLASSEELKTMQGLVKDSYHLVYASVDFEEENPMRCIAGLEVITAIHNGNELIHTVPSFEELQAGGDFSRAAFYISTAKDNKYIQELLFISDVTKNVLVVDAELALKGSEDEEPFEKMENREDVSAFIANLNTNSNFEKVEESDFPAEVEELDFPAVVEENIDIPPQKVEEPSNSKETKTNPNKSEPRDKASILRVDSRRIDVLMNLVSESVINKASLNQYDQEQSSLHSQTHQLLKEGNDKIQGILTSLQQYSDSRNFTDMPKDFTENFGTLLEVLKNEFKSSCDAVYSNMNKLGEKKEQLKSINNRINRNTGDLHEAILRIRMVPIEQLFSRFLRQVRDLSKKLNKEVHLEIKGAETELDKAIIEELVDPIMHCIRNAMDHGLETIDERKAIGKPVVGNLKLEASNQGDVINIRIEDDGAGINKERVLKKAIANGIVTPQSNLSDHDIHQLILRPGFSTADEVTDLSGRGVGLDVVKSHIDNLNGTIRIHSEEGVGTAFIITLPLTLAIIQGLLIKIFDNTFVIPISFVLENIRYSDYTPIEIEGGPSIRLRNEIIRLINLRQNLGFPSDTNEDNFIVIVQNSDGEKVGLVVDQLLGEEEIVIKPIDSLYAESKEISGATILGDGTVSLILDINRIFKHLSPLETPMKDVV